MHKQTVKMGVRNENKAAALQFPTSCQDTERSVLLLFCLKVCDGLVFYFHISFIFINFYFEVLYFAKCSHLSVVIYF